MSISTQGGDQRRPSVVSTGKKSPTGGKKSSTDDTESATGGEATATDKSNTSAEKSAAKPTIGKQATGGKSGKSGAGARPGGRPGAGRPGAGGKGRKPVAPVKVSQGRAWGPIALFVAVGVLAAGIIGYGAYAVYQNAKPWEKRAAEISGIVNYNETDKSAVDPLPGQQSHVKGPLTYKVSPPVGSSHNTSWQNCMGDVYDAPIANEHAVHSLEHGAVWITYRPDLPADQVEKLASRVRGNEFMMMSPYENLDKAISLQAWGYQLKVDNADDARIDEFITALRKNATQEPEAGCSSGITATGTTPRDLQPGM